MFESKEQYAKLHFECLKNYIEELEHTNDKLVRNDLDRMNMIIGYVKAFEKSLNEVPYECEIR